MEEIKKLVGGLMKIDLTKICDTNAESKERSKSRSEPQKANVRHKKQKMNSEGRVKYTMGSKISNPDKENIPNTENTMEPVAWSKLNYDTHRVPHNQTNIETSQQYVYDRMHNRNYSTGSIMQLKEIDSNQIINQKLAMKNQIHQEINGIRPSTAFYQKISVSNNINNIQMIPAPVYPKKEERRTDSGMF